MIVFQSVFAQLYFTIFPSNISMPHPLVIARKRVTTHIDAEKKYLETQTVVGGKSKTIFIRTAATYDEVFKNYQFTILLSHKMEISEDEIYQYWLLEKLMCNV